jgi:hypothetical protein
MVMDGSHDSGLVADEANSHDMLERLRRAEERLRVAMDEDHLGVWRCDFSPGQIAFSPGVGQHLGLPTDTRLTLETYYGYVYPEDRERVRQAVEQSIRKGEDHDAEYRT